MKTFLLAWSLSLGVPVFEAKSVSLFSKRLCPAASGRFRRKRAPISPWVLGFWTVFGGCCPLLVSLTWGNVGTARCFGSIPLAKPPRSRKRGLRAVRAGQQTLRSAPDSRGARGEAGAKGRALRGRSHEREQGTGGVFISERISVPCSCTIAIVHRGGMRVWCVAVSVRGRETLFLSAFAVRQRQGAPGSPSCAVARKNGAGSCPMRRAFVWLLEKSAGYEREQR